MESLKILTKTEKIAEVMYFDGSMKSAKEIKNWVGSYCNNISIYNNHDILLITLITSKEIDSIEPGHFIIKFPGNKFRLMTPEVLTNINVIRNPDNQTIWKLCGEKVIALKNRGNIFAIGNFRTVLNSKGASFRVAINGIGDYYNEIIPILRPRELKQYFNRKGGLPVKK